MRGSTWVKICGVTLPEDVESTIGVGANAIGLNFIPRSKRRVEPSWARRLCELAKGKIERVAVVADMTEQQVLELVEFVGLDRVQLHGRESDAMVARLGSLAYKAVGVESAADVQVAERVPGERVLVDAKVGGMVGGTGTTFDWQLVTGLCRTRSVIVAGGLGPSNVAAAVEGLRPYGIDVASGVELPGKPGVKDASLLIALLTAIRDAESA